MFRLFVFYLLVSIGSYSGELVFNVPIDHVDSYEYEKAIKLVGDDHKLKIEKIEKVLEECSNYIGDSLCKAIIIRFIKKLDSIEKYFNINNLSMEDMLIRGLIDLNERGMAKINKDKVLKIFVSLVGCKCGFMLDFELTEGKWYLGNKRLN